MTGDEIDKLCRRSFEIAKLNLDADAIKLLEVQQKSLRATVVFVLSTLQALEEQNTKQ